jgi:hypothetical protein
MTREQAEKFMDSFVSGPGLFTAKNHLNIPRICRDIKARYHPDSVTDEAEKARRHEIFVKIGQAEEVLCGGQNG